MNIAEQQARYCTETAAYAAGQERNTGNSNRQMTLRNLCVANIVSHDVIGSMADASNAGPRSTNLLSGKKSTRLSRSTMISPAVLALQVLVLVQEMG
jgi:hypothetical protein